MNFFLSIAFISALTHAAFAYHIMGSF